MHAPLLRLFQDKKIIFFLSGVLSLRKKSFLICPGAVQRIELARLIH